MARRIAVFPSGDWIHGVSDPKAFSMAADSGMLREGRLVRRNADKGFRFIRPDEAGKDVFVHVSCRRSGTVPGPVSRSVYSVGADRRGLGPGVVKRGSGALVTGL